MKAGCVETQNTQLSCNIYYTIPPSLSSSPFPHLKSTGVFLHVGLLFLQPVVSLEQAASGGEGTHDVRLLRESGEALSGLLEEGVAEECSPVADWYHLQVALL